MPYTTHRPTARVLDIMQLLSTSKEGCSLTEIATAISVPKSTIVPIIRTLCERRFITQHGSNKYTVGISALIVGYGHTGALQIPDEAHRQCHLGSLPARCSCRRRCTLPGKRRIS